MLRRAAHVAIRGYQLTVSGLIGRQCRHWPSCSEYTDTAIHRHGLWPGAWMGFSRICRCGPFGTHGIDLVPEALPTRARWFMPWRYARWRGVNAPPNPFSCEVVDIATLIHAAIPTLPAGPEPPHTPPRNAHSAPGREAPRETDTASA